MNKLKNGFTLVELLAVITLLCLLAILIVPNVTDAIKESRQNVAILNVKNYAIEVEKFVMKSYTGSNKVADGTYTVIELKNKGLSISGEEPSSGNVTISNGKVTNITGFKLSSGKVSYTNDGTNITTNISD